LNVVDVLQDLQPGVPSAVLRGETYVSIYSPVNADYELGSAQLYATLRGEYAATTAAPRKTPAPPSCKRATGSTPGPRARLDQPALRQRLAPTGEPAPLAMTVTPQGAGWKRDH